MTIHRRFAQTKSFCLYNMLSCAIIMVIFRRQTMKFKSLLNEPLMDQYTVAAGEEGLAR